MVKLVIVVNLLLGKLVNYDKLVHFSENTYKDFINDNIISYSLTVLKDDFIIALLENHIYGKFDNLFARNTEENIVSIHCLLDCLDTLSLCFFATNSNFHWPRVTSIIKAVKFKKLNYSILRVTVKKHIVFKWGAIYEFGVYSLHQQQSLSIVQIDLKIYHNSVLLAHHICYLFEKTPDRNEILKSAFMSLIWVNISLIKLSAIKTNKTITCFPNESVIITFSPVQCYLLNLNLHLSMIVINNSFFKNQRFWFASATNFLLLR